MDILHFFISLDTQLGSMIATHGNLIYIILFAIVFSEIGLLPLFFLPGDPLIFIIGSFCKLGSIELSAMMVTLMIAAFFGNLVSYRIGMAIGNNIDARQYRWINKKALERSRAFYKKHGRATLFLSPFIAVVRTFAPFLAGVSRMPFSQYMIAANIGTSFWIASLMLAGYFFGEIPFVRQHMASIVLSGLGIGLICIGVGASLSNRKNPN